MKKKLYLFTTILLATAAFSLSSCLKENPYYVNLSNSKPLVELPIASYTGSVQPVSLPLSSTPQSFPLIVNVASPQLLTSTTAVVLETDPTFTAADTSAFNTANGTHCILLPTADYTANWNVSIAPGEPHDAPLNISVSTNLLNPAQAYVVAIKIKSAPYTVDQYNEVYFIVQILNQYDGEYSVTGTMVDATVPTITGNYPVDYDLETQSANSVALFDFSYSGAFYHEILSSGAVNVYGEFSPVFTFDANNNVTSVVNYYGQPATDGRSAALDPTGVNKFTAGTPGKAGSVFQVSYYLVQPTGTNRTHFVETYTYLGPRQ